MPALRQQDMLYLLKMTQTRNLLQSRNPMRLLLTARKLLFLPMLKMSIYAKEFLAIYYAFKEFGHIFWGTPKPVIILTDNKSVTRFFQTKIIQPTLWNACDFVIQFNFTIAHIPGKNNTAADYLSRMEMDPTEKLVLKIRADVETQPIEVNVPSAGMSEEEQVFLTEEDNETEGQSWERKGNQKQD